MIHHFVFDTVGFIHFHCDFFEKESSLSASVVNNLRKCLSEDHVDYKLIIPSIVFVEIFDKQLRDDEKASQFKYEILSQYLNCDDVEIKSLDKEVLEIYYSINDNIIQLETHDKIILSSTIQMGGKLITNDSKIKTYIDVTNVVEAVF